MDIVLIAGLWLDAGAWDPLVPLLEDAGHHPLPLLLPGQGDGSESATLVDQIAAVTGAIDKCRDPVLVVGHSAACTLAWLAADARPRRIAEVVMIGGFPSADGDLYADLFPHTDGAMPFPGWAQFEGPDSRDLDQPTKDRLAAAFIPVPGGVTKAVVHLRDPRRHEVPVVIVCPEFGTQDAREWVGNGVAELQ